MNHGIINELYYPDTKSKITKETILFEKLKAYFSKWKSRDRYYVAMKTHAIKICKEKNKHITLAELGSIVNLHHSTLLYHINSLKNKVDDYDLFIEKNFNNFIDNGLYPVTTKSIKAFNLYGPYRILTADRIPQKTKKSKSKSS